MEWLGIQRLEIPVRRSRAEKEQKVYQFRQQHTRRFHSEEDDVRYEEIVR